MRKFLAFFFAITCIYSVKAQTVTSRLYTDQQLEDIQAQAEKLKKTTLLVIVDNNQSPTAKKYISAVESMWKFNPFRVTKSDSLDRFIQNPAYSILSIFFENREKGNGVNIGIFLGDPKNKEFEKTEEFVSIPITSKNINRTASIDSLLKENDFLLPFFIQRLQNEVEKATKRVNTTVTTSKKSFCTYYDNAQEVLENKTVLIFQNGIDKHFDPKSFCKNFKIKPEQYHLVDKKEIEQAIKKQNEKMAFIYDFSNGYGKIYDVNGKLLAEGAAKKAWFKKLYNYAIIPAAAIVFYLLAKGYNS